MMQTQGAAGGDGVPELCSRPVTDWTLTLLDSPDPTGTAATVGDPLAVQVPSSVHGALIGAGRLRDIAVDADEEEGAWISRSRWRYATTIARPATPPRHAVLEFTGIDTISTISVNGRPRLHTWNMFRSHQLDLTADLAAGPVEVWVDIRPALTIAEETAAADPLPFAGNRPFNQVRKMACAFGWDWGPTTATAGLWRPVLLHTWSTGRFRDLRMAASLASGLAGGPALEVSATVDGTAHKLAVRVTPAGDPRPETCLASGWASVTEGRVELPLAVPAARTWWPRGLGEQPLYDVVAELLDAEGGVLDRVRRRVGFRDVALVQIPDPEGISCEIHVNGRRVWVRGLDWIPDDCFPERVDAARVRGRIRQAVDAGANLLRVWGGGLLESEEFYDACDELGVLVWQDFLFACAAYPEDPTTVDSVRAEVTDHVRRLRHRASLVLWCGGNETLWGYEDWGWKEQLDGRPWGELYYRRLLPELVAALDGTRPYVPGSPFSPDQRATNASTAGAMHVWDVWNGRDYPDYELRRPRFVSEFGWQAPPSWPTLARAVGLSDIADLDPTDPRVQVRQKAEDGMAKLAFGLEQHLPEPPTRGPAYYFATQLTQARAASTGIRHFRGLHELCSGTVWWQLNDCWPTLSWSIVDVAGRRKLAWYAVRDSYAPRLAVLTGDRRLPGLVLVNDTDQEWPAEVTLRAVDVDGRELAAAELTAAVPALG
jgi:beta-mannosidase